MDIRTENDGKESVRHFWAFPVWNYAENMVQIFEVTQKQIMSGIKDVIDDEAWGDPKQNDIAVTRNGSGFDTEYLTKGIPHKPLDPKIIAEFENNPVNLAALFEGGDPFAGKPSTAEAVDGPGFQEPAIEQEPPPAPDRYNTVPAEFRPKALKEKSRPRMRRLFRWLRLELLAVSLAPACSAGCCLPRFGWVRALPF